MKRKYINQSELLDKSVKTPFDMELILWMDYAIDEETELRYDHERGREAAQCLQDIERAYNRGTLSLKQAKEWEEGRLDHASVLYPDGNMYYNPKYRTKDTI